MKFDFSRRHKTPKCHATLLRSCTEESIARSYTVLVRHSTRTISPTNDMRYLNLLALLGLSTLASGKGCGSKECVRYYSDDGCNNEEGDYVPTCGGNCFSYGFNSIKVAGNGGSLGPACYMYSDSNCQHQVDYIRNTQGESGCYTYNTYGSMKCYYNC